ncbi:AMP-binding protein [Corynebacterium sp. 319]|uniref:AMP-binding protein n=1 Tax=unclassified Corynebacterium TaxID=2624378 RepID=UPI00125CCBB6|nr:MULTISPECIES: AMP-binding protein [unclassified Corynebacterium]KAB1554270.1 AMP-binding protein [Corynebacterium sp. 319]KAB3539986.1 AMP-binding protein [Corynebacterium sp. 366]
MTQEHAPQQVPLEANVINAADLPAALPLMKDLLNGTRSLIPLDRPHPSPNIPALMRAGELVDAGMLIASTSGSTGTPKGAMLTHENILASITATENYARSEFGAEPGPWLLALPAHHIAGLQVILRSLHAGHEPVVSRHLLSGTSFSGETFIQDAARLRELYPDEDLYVSLVPTQLERILAVEGGLESLTTFAMVLVGGAAARGTSIDDARRAGAPIVTTYGSAETAGGAVYNHRPLPGVTLSIDSPDSRGVGLVVINGPMVSPGYRNAAFGRTFPAEHTFVTSDLGQLDGTGELTLLGRADGAINTGGYKVLPEEVEKILWTAFPDAHLACAVRLESDEFGESIGVALELPDAVADSDPGHVFHTPRGRAFVDITKMVRSTLRGSVDRHLIPSRAIALENMPTIGPGKVDRMTVKQTMNTITQW